MKSEAARLREVGIELRAIRAEIDTFEAQVRTLQQARVELTQVLDTRPPVPPTLEALHREHLRRRAVIEALREIGDARDSIVASLRLTVPERKRLSRLADSIRDGADLTAAPATLINNLQDILDRVVDIGREANAVPISDALRELESRFAPLDEEYLRQRQLEQTVTDSLRREDFLRRQLSDLEKAERELTQKKEQSEQLQEQRQHLRETISALRDEIFDLRMAEIEKVNREYGHVVLLELRRDTRSKRYVDKLTDLISGSRIRTQGDLAQDIADNLLPKEILELVESADAQKLAQMLGRDIGQTTRLVSFLRDHPNLYDLEALWNDDTLEMTMFDDGVPKPVEELSDGQKATALLPLILRDGVGPLIVDQPEDDLDNKFIYGSLVKSIRPLKSRRQLIFVTHNANIPVLGDADRIVVMHMQSPETAAPPRIGTLNECKEDVLELLEGGREAFALREQSYGDLLR
jgi:DNA repair exonuclease SbcCD ATPase subunit